MLLIAKHYFVFIKVVGMPNMCLTLNFFFFHKIGGDGNCMLNSVLCQLELATDGNKTLFGTL